MLDEVVAGRRRPPGRSGGARHRRRAGHRRDRNGGVTFAGKTVLVTGAAKGIGQAVALALGARRRPRGPDRSRRDALSDSAGHGGFTLENHARASPRMCAFEPHDVSRMPWPRHRALRRHRRARQQRRHPFRPRRRGLHRRGMEPDLRGERERRVLHDSRGVSRRCAARAASS